MQRVVEEKIERLIQECDKHVLRINSAAGKLQNTMPLTADRYEQLTEEQIEHFDQFLFRFAKLQDALGQRLSEQYWHCCRRMLRGCRLSISCINLKSWS